MAGHGYVKQDPAIERWNNMREDAYKHFRWTPRTAKVAMISLAVIPAGFFYVFNSTHLKWDWTAKGKGESLKREAS